MYARAKIERNIQVDGDCWIWTGKTDTKGYGRADHKVNGKKLFEGAHRYTYKTLVGPIPEGLEIDHLCRVPLCVAPHHLEAVTPEENRRRAIEAKALLPHEERCYPSRHKPDGTCGTCGKALAYSGMGRPRSFCSKLCKRRYGRQG